MSNIYRGPSIDASYQVSVHMAMWLQRRRFLEIEKSITRIAYGGRPCLLMDQDEMSNLYYQFIWPSGVRGEHSNVKS